MLDIKIVGGTIVDGTGAPPINGSVGIRDGRIVAIGDVAEKAARTIDATGRIVSPGFVDVHTHYDAQAFWDPTFSPSCYHGVTTILGGFCGFSIAPLTPDAGAYLMTMLARVEGMPVETLKAGVPWDWSSFGEYLGRLDGRVLLNAGFFVGHSAVRRVVMGERANRDPATPEDMAAMTALVSPSLGEGALGFSTTVSPTHNDAAGSPVPSRFAAREELMELAAVLRDHAGTTLELLPNLDFSDDTIDLLVDFSLAGGRPVNWNVMAIQGGSAEERERIGRQLSAGRIARERGAEVVALTFASSPTIRLNLVSGFVFDSLPGWAPLFRLPLAERIAQLRSPFVREVLSGAVKSLKGAGSTITQWHNYRLAEVFAEENKPWQGRMIGELAAELGKSPFDTMMDIAVADDLRTSFMLDGRGEDAEGYAFRAEMWASDLTVVGASDAGAHMDMIDSFAFSTTLLQKARDYGLMPIEQVVRQLTQVPAQTMGITDRGVLAVGAYADVVIFDAATVARGPVYTRYDLPGTSSEGRLYAEAIGVDYVIVNGQVAVDQGAVTDARPGTVLRSGRDTFTRDIPAALAAA
ncbi:amidohydrolase family protein [soil metagenome]